MEADEKGFRRDDSEKKKTPDGVGKSPSGTGIGRKRIEEFRRE